MGVHTNFIVKLDFEIAVDQKTWEASVLRVPAGARGTATPIFGQFLAQFCQIALTCSLLKAMLSSALLVDT